MNVCDLQRFRRKTPVAAEVHADRFTVAKKNGTSAETYGEPQTPVNRFAVALSSELPEFSTAVLAAKRVSPHSGASPGVPLVTSTDVPITGSFTGFPEISEFRPIISYPLGRSLGLAGWPSTAFLAASSVNFSVSLGMPVMKGLIIHPSPVGMSRVSEATSLCT